MTFAILLVFAVAPVPDLCLVTSPFPLGSTRPEEGAISGCVTYDALPQRTQQFGGVPTGVVGYGPGWLTDAGRVEWFPVEKPDLCDQLRAENKERWTIGGGIEFLPEQVKVRPNDREQIFNFWIGFTR